MARPPRSCSTCKWLLDIFHLITPILKGRFSLYDDLPRPGQTNQKVVCTQPRRLAAMEVAQRVAVELDVDLGKEVGYVFHNENATGLRTVLSYTTDGHLLQELKRDMALSTYDCVVIDEVHERTVATDILLAKIRELCKMRPELKLVVMSATMNAEKFQRYFANAPIHRIPGRTYPVDVFYIADQTFDHGKTESGTVHNFVHALSDSVVHIHQSEDPGDILVFVPGKDDAETLVTTISQRTVGMVVLPLYSKLSKQRQRIALGPLPKHMQHFRKCIVATNIAETSLTIDGIVYVVVSLFENCHFVPTLTRPIGLRSPQGHAL